jgi:hypothetical protein
LRQALTALVSEYPDAAPAAFDASSGALRAVQGMYDGALVGALAR